MPKIGLPLGILGTTPKKKKQPYCNPLLNDMHIYVKLNRACDHAFLFY
jgi:hypothetical protein